MQSPGRHSGDPLGSGESQAPPHTRGGQQMGAQPRAPQPAGEPTRHMVVGLLVRSAGPSPAAFVTRDVCPGNAAALCAVDPLCTFLSRCWVPREASPARTACSLWGGSGCAGAGQGSCWALGPTGGVRWANCLRSQGPGVPVLPVPGCPWWAPTLTCPGVSLQAVHGAGACCSALPLSSPLGLLLWGHLGVLPAGVGTWCWEGGENPGVTGPDSCLHGSVAPGEDRPAGHHSEGGNLSPAWDF